MNRKQNALFATGLALVWIGGIVTGFFAGRMWEMAHSTFEDAALAAAQPRGPSSTAGIRRCTGKEPCGVGCLQGDSIIVTICPDGDGYAVPWTDEPLPPRRNQRGEMGVPL